LRVKVLGDDDDWREKEERERRFGRRNEMGLGDV
jgi:hypothetical protein